MLASWLVMLAAVGALFLVGSADAGYTVSVTPAEQNGVPEETLSFTITIDNTDPDDDDTFNIAVSFVGSVDQDCDGCWDTWVSQASLSIDADESGSTNFYVKIGDIAHAEADSDERVLVEVTPTVDNEAYSQDVRVIVDPAYGCTLELLTQESPDLDPFDTYQFDFNITNSDGNAEDNIALSYSASSEDGMSIAYPPQVSDIGMGETAGFSVTISIDETTAAKGTRYISVTATSADGSTNVSTTFQFTVNIYRDIQLSEVDTGSKDIIEGGSVYYGVTVTNVGNSADTFVLSIDESSIPADWDAQLGSLTDTGSLAPGASYTFSEAIFVYAPDDAVADDIALIDIVVTSDADTNTSKSFQTRSTVAQNYKPTIQTTSQTSSGAPGTVVSYTFTVTNAGNGNDEFSIEITEPNADECAQNNAACWGVDLTPDDVTPQMSPDGFFEFTLNITINENALKQSYTVVINATSSGAGSDGSYTTKNVYVEVSARADISLDSSGTSNIEVDAGQTAEYNLTITNDGNDEDDISLSATCEACADGDWTFQFVGGSTVTIAAESSTTVVFRVDSPDDAIANPYTTVITATSSIDETETATTEVITEIKEKFEVDLDSTESQKPGTPSDTVEFSLTVTNDGSGVDEIELTYEFDEASSGEFLEFPSFSNNTVSLNPGESASVTFSLQVSEDADDVSHGITVTATSKNAESEEGISVTDMVSLTVVVQPVYDVRLTSDTTVVTANPSESIDFEMTLENQGTDEDTITITAEYPSAIYSVSISPNAPTVSEGSNVTISVTITVDEDALKDIYNITFTATSENDGTVDATHMLDVDVAQRYEIEILFSDGSYEAAPSEEAVSNVTLTNKGTGDDRVQLSIDNDDCITRYSAENCVGDWGSLAQTLVPAADGSFAAEETAEVALTVTIPSSAEPSVTAGVYYVTVAVQSLDNETAMDFVDIQIVVKTISVDLSGVSTTADIEPGRTGQFTVDVTNDGQVSDTITVTISESSGFGWASFDEDGSTEIQILLAAGAISTVTINLDLPNYDNVTGSEKQKLAADYNYNFKVEAKTSVGSVESSNSVTMTATIEQIYGVTVELINSAVTNASTFPSAEIETTIFDVLITNLGNGQDNFKVETSQPTGLTVGVFNVKSSSSCSDEWSQAQDPINAADDARVYLCLTPQESDLDVGEYPISMSVKARNGGDSPESIDVELEVKEPTRDFSLTVETAVKEVAPEFSSSGTPSSTKNVVKFRIIVQNDGSHDDRFVPDMVEGYNTATNADIGGNGVDWSWDFYESQTETSSNKWGGSQSYELIDSGAQKELWFIIHVDSEDVQSGTYNMTLKVEIEDQEGDIKLSKTTTVSIIVNEPTPGMSLTIYENVKDIQPDYEGSASDNEIQFKIKIENTGSHTDSFIYVDDPDAVEDGWDIEFQTSTGSTWDDNNGEDIQSTESKDMYVVISVDDEAEVGNYTIRIDIQNSEGDSEASDTAVLYVMVLRPDLALTPADITLLVNNAEANASLIREDDSLAISIAVKNSEDTDEFATKADDVLVEVYVYPRTSPDPGSTLATELEFTYGFTQDNDYGFIKMIYSRENRIDVGGRDIGTSDWSVIGGEWYIEVRVDYDSSDDNGKILETNENNNKARYAELLQIKADLSISEVYVDSKYVGNGSSVPNLGDTVTFTATVANTGAADIQDAKLFITGDTTTSNEILKTTSSQSYVEFDVDAGGTKQVTFRWKAGSVASTSKLVSESWNGIRISVNPRCSDFNLFGCDTELDREFDELNRYQNNEYPSSGQFTQNGYELAFNMLPDFTIAKVKMNPSAPTVGETVAVTVTIENIGNTDWEYGSGSLYLVFDDSIGDEVTTQIGSSIDKGGDFDVEFDWIFPEAENKNEIKLSFELDAGSGSNKIEQLSSDNDDEEVTLEVVLPAVLGDVPGVEFLTKRELIPGVPMYIPVVLFLGVFVVGLPVLFKLRSLTAAAAKAEAKAEGKSDDDGDKPASAAPAAAAATEAAPAAPSKIGLSIKSPDGKTANVKVPSIMPVQRLLQNCVNNKFIPDANFNVMLDGKPVDPNTTLGDAGFKDGSEVQLAPKQ